MELFTWKDGFATRVEEMDNQHRQFFSLLNDVNHAVERQQEKEIMNPLLATLAKYIRVHFSAEEMLLESYGYPDLAHQRKQHDFFITQVEDLSKRYESGEGMVGTGALQFMRDWFLNHILDEDKKYGEFVSAKIGG